MFLGVHAKIQLGKLRHEYVLGQFDRRDARQLLHRLVVVLISLGLQLLNVVPICLFPLVLRHLGHDKKFNWHFLSVLPLLRQRCQPIGYISNTERSQRSTLCRRRPRHWQTRHGVWACGPSYPRLPCLAGLWPRCCGRLGISIIALCIRVLRLLSLLLLHLLLPLPPLSI